MLSLWLKTWAELWSKDVRHSVSPQGGAAGGDCRPDHLPNAKGNPGKFSCSCLFYLHLSNRVNCHKVWPDQTPLKRSAPLTDAGWQRSVQSALSELLTDWLKCRRQRQKLNISQLSSVHIYVNERDIFHAWTLSDAWRGQVIIASLHRFHRKWIESKQRCIPWVEPINLRD